MGFYVEHTTGPYRSGIAGEDIPVGHLVQLVDGEVFLADADRASTVEGVADALRSGEYIQSFMHEAGDFIYLADPDDTDNHAPLSQDGGHVVPIGGGTDGSYIKLVAADDDDADTPDISDGDVVGFVDTTAADAPDAAGQVVEAGYTNDGFTAEGAEFVAIGRAYRDDAAAHGDIVRVVVDKAE